jgi:hypothetical protein
MVPYRTALSSAIIRAFAGSPAHPVQLAHHCAVERVRLTPGAEEIPDSCCGQVNTLDSPESTMLKTPRQRGLAVGGGELLNPPRGMRTVFFVLVGSFA